MDCSLLDCVLVRRGMDGTKEFPASFLGSALLSLSLLLVTFIDTSALHLSYQTFDASYALYSLGLFKGILGGGGVVTLEAWGFPTNIYLQECITIDHQQTKTNI